MVIVYIAIIIIWSAVIGAASLKMDAIQHGYKAVREGNCEEWDY